VKPGAKAQEGSLAAPEDAKVGASRKLFSWQIRKMREPAEIEYSSAAQLPMQGSVEVRGASKAQPEVETPGASQTD